MDRLINAEKSNPVLTQTIFIFLYGQETEMNKKLREENATELAEKQVRTWNMTKPRQL